MKDTETTFDPSKIDPAKFFIGDNVVKFLQEFEAQHAPAALDMEIKKNRDLLRTQAAEIPRIKTTLDNAGKDYVAEIKQQSAAIDKNRKLLRDRLDVLKEVVRQPLTKWESDEAVRIEREAIAAKISACWDEAHTLNELLTFQRAEQKRLAAEQEAERIRIEAEQRATRDAEIAERARIAAETAAAEKIRAAEQARVDAEQRARIAEQLRYAAERTEADRQRLAAEQAQIAAAEAEKRNQRTEEQRAEIEAAAARALVDTGLLGDNAAAQLIALIAAGKIPGIRMEH